MSGGGSGHIDYGRSGGARAGAIGGAPRVTADLGDGQWPGVCGPGSGCVGLRTRREAALHRTGEAGPECVHRELQRQDAGRMLERALVHEFGRSSGDDRSLEEGLQRGSAPYFVGESDPARIHSARCSSAVAYGSLRAAPKRRANANNYPRTRIMIGTENGGRSLGTLLVRKPPDITQMIAAYLNRSRGSDTEGTVTGPFGTELGTLLNDERFKGIVEEAKDLDDDQKIGVASAASKIVEEMATANRVRYYQDRHAEHELATISTELDDAKSKISKLERTVRFWKQQARR